MPHAELTRPVHRPTLAALAVAVCAVLLLGLTAGSPSHAYGPSKRYVTILKGQFTFIPLKNQAMVSRSKSGYIYRAGQQDSRLTVTRTERGLRFHDAGTRRWHSLAKPCRKARARVGVAAVCTVPRWASKRNAMLLQVWPRLGDDFVDTSDLGRHVDVTVLGDAGHDVALLGDGDDFFNGAFGRDRARGGGGSDWLRAGDAVDVLRGGRGHDRVVGVAGNDFVSGGRGSDRIEGGAGHDRVNAGRGRDRISCGGGRDRAAVAGRDRNDRISGCERLRRG